MNQRNNPTERTNMKFNADEIASVIQAEVEQYESQIDVREVGTVLEVGDGIGRNDDVESAVGCIDCRG